MGIMDTLKPIGDWVTGLTQGILKLVPTEFLSEPTTARIITLLINATIIYLVFKFAGSLSKLAKVGIFVLLGLLGLSILATFT